MHENPSRYGFFSAHVLSFPVIHLFSRLNTGCDGVSVFEDHLSASETSSPCVINYHHSFLRARSLLFDANPSQLCLSLQLFCEVLSRNYHFSTAVSACP